MGNVKKNKTANVPTKNGGSYKYSYTDLAAVNDYLEENNYTYDQYTQAFETPEGLCDYIMTQRYELAAGKREKFGEPMRGLRIQYANETPQQLGSRITYLRRYSLLMAFGLAAEDDDAADIPATGNVKPQVAVHKIDFAEVRGELPEIETVEELELYWKSLGKMSDGQTKILQSMFAKRKKELQEGEGEDGVE